MAQEKTAMKSLRDALVKAHKTSIDAVNRLEGEYKPEQIAQIVDVIFEKTIEGIDVNYFAQEKNQIRKTYNQGGKWASEIGSEAWFNEEFTQGDKLTKIK